MVQLGKRIAGTQFALEAQEEISESASEQVKLPVSAQPCLACSGAYFPGNEYLCELRAVLCRPCCAGLRAGKPCVNLIDMVFKCMCMTHVIHAVQADVQTVDITFEEHGAAVSLGFAAAQAGHEQQLDSSEVPPHVLHSIQSGLASGFQLASAAGPLCDEPMWGVAFEVRRPLLFLCFICRHLRSASQSTLSLARRMVGSSHERNSGWKAIDHGRIERLRTQPAGCAEGT